MSGDSENCRTEPADFLAGCEALIGRLYAESGSAKWGLTREQFVSALARSARKRFSGGGIGAGKVEEYLATLHLQDLALASACAEAREEAWEQFVATFRNYLRSAAAAILRCPTSSPAARELADSLFADLYGLGEGKRSERSLFRYFHGRSSLKTWLRAVLAQRHVDGIRANRRFRELVDGEETESAETRVTAGGARSEAAADPHRERYVALFTHTLEVALGLLDPRDKERLRLYYAEERTLAEIGQRFGEHESSVSRNLERTRRELRFEVEQVLRKGSVAADGDGSAGEPGLSDAEIALCFEYAAEDAPIDLEKLLPQPGKRSSKVERQES